jgi:hypothetical protein
MACHFSQGAAACPAIRLKNQDRLRCTRKLMVKELAKTKLVHREFIPTELILGIK